jgi:hypothetical protein
VLIPGTLWAHAELDVKEAERAANSPWPNPPATLAVKMSALGYSHFAADMMWLAAIQYYGTTRNERDGHFRLLVPFLERVVALDPLFEYAYRFGGVAAVGSKGENVERANALLLQGAKARPDIWRIPYIRASNCLQFTGDKVCMAQGFTAAARLPDSPPWMGLLASRYLSDETRPSEVFDLLARLAENTDDPMLRLRVEERLGDLQVVADLKAISAAIERFRQRREDRLSCPKELSELVDNDMTKVPHTPGGAPYELTADCEPKQPGFREKMP